MRRQNYKIIQQNETILEMLETQMKLFLEDKTLGKNDHQTTSSNPSDNVQSTCNFSQSLAVSNPLYKFNTNTTTTTNKKAKPDGMQVHQQATVKKSQDLQMGRSQPTQKISRALAVWQVGLSLNCFLFRIKIFSQVVKPLSAKTSGLQEQLLAQLSNLLMEKVMKMRVMIMVVILMNLLHLEEKRDHLQSSFAVNQQNSCLFSVWTLILRSVCSHW